MGISDQQILDAPTSTNEKPVLLIVDDEAGPRESLRMVFKDQYRCAIATCGREGIEYASQHRVDVAILDIRMPDYSGVEVLREIKQIDPNVECIMLTGYETIDTARDAVHYGASEYLNKPFDVFAIREIMERCLTRHGQKIQAQRDLQTMMQNTLQRISQISDALSTARADYESVVADCDRKLNNPWAVLDEYARSLKRELMRLDESYIIAPENTQQCLTGLLCDIDRCQDISNRLLRSACGNQHKLTRIETAKLLEDVATILRAHPNHYFAVVTVNETGSLPLDVCLDELIQVFLDLSINALQAMNGEGVIWLTATVATPPADCTYRANSFDPHRPHVCIEICDNGYGASTETQTKVLTPSSITKTNENSSGIASVAELVGHHHGAIAVAGQPGTGTPFRVYLPLVTGSNL